MTPVIELAQAWARPRAPRPVVIIGAGGIVENAHLPAYRAIGVTVRGLYDLDGPRAAQLAARFGIARSYGSLAEAAAEPGALFDVAVPARAVPSVIAALPRCSAVLIQKPMGETLDEARAIATLCERSELVAAVNFQLRYSPNMLALAAAIRAGELGELVDVEVRVNTYTPWHLWPFLKGLARHEILYHSIHYLDLIRSLLGEPRGVL